MKMLQHYGTRQYIKCLKLKNFFHLHFYALQTLYQLRYTLIFFTLPSNNALSLRQLFLHSCINFLVLPKRRFLYFICPFYCHFQIAFLTFLLHKHKIILLNTEACRIFATGFCVLLFFSIVNSPKRLHVPSSYPRLYSFRLADG